MTTNANGVLYNKNFNGNFTFNFKVTGLDGHTLRFVYRANNYTVETITEDGYYSINMNISKLGCRFVSDENVESCNITIEQIPDYQGALVSDGVDDYGLCENFPILTRDRGFTICAIREDIENDTNCALLSNGINNSSANAVFIFEGRATNGQIISSWGHANVIKKTSNKFSFLNSNSYNGITITKGLLAESYDNKIALFSYSTNNTNLLKKSALYALEIYDRDLTDEEIAKVKARMIAEYEEKTGNKYEEETV